MLRNIISGILLSGIVWTSSAQRIVPADEALKRALAGNRHIVASALEVTQQQQLLKSAVNLPNPEFFWESPTGNFYTGSITQSIEFPIVYTNQRRLQKQQVRVAEKEKQLTETELKLRVRTLYLETQFLDSLAKQLYIQDTLYERIKESSVRQFNAGQIDYLQQTFSETQYGEIHNEYLKAVARLRSNKVRLQMITGIKDSFSLEPLMAYITETAGAVPDSAALLSNPSVQLIQEQQAAAKQQLAVQKSKALPGLAFGYFNQGERDTKWNNRFRFGVTIPLWFSQYKGNIAAAKTEQLVLENRREGLQQDLSMQVVEATGEMESNRRAVQYYRYSAVPKVKEMLDVSRRFFISGEIDYTTLMRNSNDAYSILRKSLESVRDYNLSVINYQFLMGLL